MRTYILRTQIYVNLTSGKPRSFLILFSYCQTISTHSNAIYEVVLYRWLLVNQHSPTLQKKDARCSYSLSRKPTKKSARGGGNKPSFLGRPQPLTLPNSLSRHQSPYLFLRPVFGSTSLSAIYLRLLTWKTSQKRRLYPNPLLLVLFSILQRFSYAQSSLLL